MRRWIRRRPASDCSRPRRPARRNSRSPSSARPATAGATPEDVMSATLTRETRSPEQARDASTGLLDRCLGVFADVRAGEGMTALLLMLNIFLLLGSYYLLKTIREPLILTV